MTPQEKANELYSKYDDLLNKDFSNPIVFDNQIKQCALIAVDEISKHCYEVMKPFWEEVKQEIENL
jgi:regulator of PEP synthase PpsR (kinase-PPPase family)